MTNTPPNWLLIALLLLWAVAQYGFAFWALRDLARRPRVRGEKKVAWALLILIVPVIGPIVYSSFGPTSFLPRRTTPAASARAGRAPARAARPTASSPASTSAPEQPRR